MDEEQKKSLQAYFRAIPYFEGLPQRDLEALASQMHSCRLKAGERLYHQGQKGESLAIVGKGEMRVVVAIESGIEVMLGLRGPGSILGEMALLEGEPRSASVDAAKDSELWILAEEDFFRALRDNPAFARHLLKVLSGRLREAGARIQTLATGSIRHRLAKFLADQAVFQGELDGLTMRLPPLSTDDMSCLLGLERRNVSRALSDLRTLKLIDGDKRGILIVDLQGLRQLAQRMDGL